jgi:hypothetical protein
MNKLTVTEQKALQEQLETLGPLTVDQGWQDNLRPEDTARPPRLRISQRNRPVKLDDGTPTDAGSIVNVELGVVYPSGLEMFPLRELPNTRVMWPEEYDANNEPLCASDDGLTPTQSDRRRLTNQQAGPCSQGNKDVCPFALWNENLQTGDRDAPRCTRQRNFLVVVIEDDSLEPVILTMQRTSMKASQKLTTYMRRLNPKAPKSIVLTTVERDNGSRQWIEYACSRGRTLDLKEQVEIRALQVEFETMYQEGRLVVEFDDGLPDNGGNADLNGGAPGENPQDQGNIPF